MSDDEKLAAKACCGQLDWHAVHVWLDFAGDRGLPVHDVAKHFALGQHTEHWDWMQKQIHDCFRDYMKYVSRDCERFGYAELEYRDSQEAIEEEIGEDDYEFDADGNLLDN
jgi:hypothetical protein